MNLKYIQKCRICGNPNLETVLDFGSHFLHGSFVYLNKPLPPQRKIPLKVLRCNPQKFENGCGLVQLSVTVPSEVLYDEYGYRSGTTEKMRKNLNEIVETTLNLMKSREDLRVLDIGANDGYTLNRFPKNSLKVGIDPSSAILDIKPGDDIKVYNTTFPCFISESHYFDVILSIAMFYDLDQPSFFVHNVKKILANQGIWVAEFGYLPIVLEQNASDYFCQEHICLYSLAIFENLIKQYGLKLIKAQINDINGGSIRCFVTHFECDIYNDKKDLEYLKLLRIKEFDLELDTYKPYEEFVNRVISHRCKVVEFIEQKRKIGKTFGLLGASTKSNLFLQFANLTNADILFASDRSLFKHGARTLGTDIPIISEKKARARKSDYFLVLIHFKDELIAREQEYIKNGGKFVFVYPDLEVYPND